MTYDPPKHDTALIRLHKEGHTMNDIWRILNIMEIRASKEDVSWAMRRLGLKSNIKVVHARPDINDRPLPKNKENPIALARHALGQRIIEKPSGYWMDNRPVSVTEIMKEYNRLRIAIGQQQITCNPQWTHVPA